MKESVITGKYIYDNLKKLYAELNELGEACDIVSDEVGQSSTAYKILDESYGAKKKEIAELEDKAFVAR